MSEPIKRVRRSTQKAESLTNEPTLRKPGSARFEKGNKGGPGRPKGSVDPLRAVIRDAMPQVLENLIRVAQTPTKEGVRASEILANRALPATRPTMPAVRIMSEAQWAKLSYTQRIDAITAASVSGAITCDMAAAYAAILRQTAQVVEMDELKHRLEELEATAKAQQQAESAADGRAW